MKQPLKSITEFGPLLAFFILYKLNGLIAATAALLVTTLIAVAITYFIEKKLPMMPLITAVIIGIFGSLTIFSGNELFIKIKPTLINLIFAAILIIGALRGKGLLKHLMESALKMEEKAWINFSARWGVFFLLLAAANELIWRNFSTDIWVDFKVFGILAATFVFMLTQLPFIKRNMLEDKEES